MKQPVIVTHDGVFHADEVFALAAVREAIRLQPSIRIEGDDYVPEDIRVLRTRDPDASATAWLAVDVGGVYNPAEGRFDHHQRGGAGSRAVTLRPARGDTPAVVAEVPYASFGLVWGAYGEEAVRAILGGDAHPETVRAVAEAVGNGLVAHVDAGDNAVRNEATRAPQMTLNNVIAGFNRGKPGSRFEEAVAFATAILRNEVAAEGDRAETLRVVGNAPREVFGSAVVAILPSYAFGWQDVEGVDAVIHPDTTEGMFVLAVKATHVIPETSDPEVSFRHNAGFMAKSASIDCLRRIAATVELKPVAARQG